MNVKGSYLFSQQLLEGLQGFLFVFEHGSGFGGAVATVTARTLFNVHAVFKTQKE